MYHSGLISTVFRGSRFCGKTETDTKPCHVNKCPEDCALGFWTAWSACSMSCGTGSKTRKRAHAREAAFGGRPCPASEPLSEQAPCVENECAVDGAWGAWSLWGYCDRRCGEGTRTRARECDAPAPEFGGELCPGEEQRQVESEACLVRECDPVDGGWTQWTR